MLGRGGLEALRTLLAGRRSLLEEYVETVLEIAELRPAGAPVEQLVGEKLRYVNALGLDSLGTALGAKRLAK